MAKIKEFKTEATEETPVEKEKKTMKEKLANGLTWGQTVFLTVLPVTAQLIVAGATVAAAVINAQAAANNLAAMQQQNNNLHNNNNE